MGRKAAAKPKASSKAAAATPPGKRRAASQVPAPSFPAGWGRPVVPEAPAGPLLVLVLDVTEGSTTSEGTDVLLHGTTMDGFSVAALVHGFRPYLYCLRPPEAEGLTEADLASALATVLKDPMAVLAVSKVVKRPLMCYHKNAVEMLRVEFASPRHLAPASRELELGIRIPRREGKEPFQFSSQTWEANVPFVLRFMVDTGLVGAGWVELPPGSFTPRSGEKRLTTAQVEVELNVSSLKPVMADGELLKLPPIRVLVLEARFDTTGSTACVFATLQLFRAAEPTVRLALVRSELGEACSGVELQHFSDEAELLERLGAFVTHVDPDLVLGYELRESTFPQLLARAQAVRAGPAAFQLGRILGAESRVKRAGSEPIAAVLEGRLLLDLLKLVQEHRLLNYSLGSLKQHFLGGTHFELGTASDVGSLLAEKPMVLARCLLADTKVMYQIFDKLCILFNLFEMGRVTGVPVDYLLTRGQMIKVTSQLLRKARENGFVIPARGHTGGETFEGGFVMEPKVGFYEEPIVVLDFASLYPSIALAHNLCYTTLLNEGQEKQLGLGPEDYTESPARTDSGRPYKFVKPAHCKGIVPMILEELLSARSVAKKAMAATRDANTKAVLNGRQLALKISANSVYGYTGATAGTLPCIELAASVTAIGRQMISSTATFIEETVEAATVVYGDTDSVMISFGKVPRQEAVSRGHEVAKAASARFPSPIRLDFEKVFQPLLLLSKKRYAGLPWDSNRPLSLDMKGIETVRRDFCGLVRQVCEKSLELLLQPSRSMDEAIDYVRSVVADLWRGEIDIRQLVISKALGKKGEEDYAAKAAHVELAEKLRKRDPQSAPRVGDRVSYVVIAGSAGAKVYERAEDPRYAVANELPIDAEYYIEQQLKQPLLRIFEPVAGGDVSKMTAKLFTSGVQQRKQTGPSASAKGGLGAFVKRGEKCLVCRANVQGMVPFCKGCETTPAAESTKASKASQGAELRARHLHLLETCQACVGPEQGEVYERCANVNCPIFFERAQVRKSMGEMKAVFCRLALEW